MPKVFAPFVIERTFKGLTFYCRGGRNFVRTKSSLTRRKVLYAPCFKNTRYYAGLMAKASKIGSLVYNQLPAHWRQFWMYQAFTGEALKMLKERKGEDEIQALLYERYVKQVTEKQTATIPVINTPLKRAYQKHNTNYWSNKTIKAECRKVNKQRMLRNAGILGRASKLASLLYRRLGLKKRCYYRKLVAMSMQLLREEWCEENSLPNEIHRVGAGVIEHREGYRYFVATLNKRLKKASRWKAFPCCNNVNFRNSAYKHIHLFLPPGHWQSRVR